MKRARQNETRRVRNRNVKSSMRTAVKVVRSAIDEGDSTRAREALPLAVKLIQRAGSKGVLKPNTVSRRVGRLTRAVEQMGAKTEKAA